MELVLQLFQTFGIDVFVSALLATCVFAFLAMKNTHIDELSKNWLTTYTYVWSRIILDISLVWGITLACIGLVGMTVNMDGSAFLSQSIVLVFSVIAITGLAAAIAFCVERENLNVPIRLSISGVILVLAIILGICFYFIESTGVPFVGGFYHLTITSVQVLFLATLTLIGSLVTSLPWQKTLFKANLGVTLFLMTLGITSWFLNWSDFESSRQSTYLIANVLMWGSVVHVSFYFVVMGTAKQPDARLRIKTWHFTEAFAFFAFLVYAPIGATEYFRESADQTALQAQHASQQSEIDELKARIQRLEELQGN